jgi:DNA-binding IclR family transcriptional regulator
MNAQPKKKGSKGSGYKPTVPAVQQALQLLTCLAESPQKHLNLTEICSRLGIHKSKGYTLLNTLKQFDFIEREDQTKTYSLGLGILYLARNILKNLDVRTTALPYLQTLAAQTGSSAHLGVVSGDRLYIVARRDVREDLEYGLREGSHYHITHGSHGKAIVAAMTKDRREKILAQDHLCFYGDGERVDMDILREEIRTCRQTGYAVDPGETNAGMIVISAPVFKHNGEVAGAVILTGTFARSKIDEFGRQVAETAHAVSRKLGHEAFT